MARIPYGPRYQIADGIVDFIHAFWIGYFLLPFGTISLGPATIFGPLRSGLPGEVLAGAMAVLAWTPHLAIRRGWGWLYRLSRVGSVGYFAYLGYLCVQARPYSTGMIYFVVAAGALALLVDSFRRGAGGDDGGAERRR